MRGSWPSANVDTNGLSESYEIVERKSLFFIKSPTKCVRDFISLALHKLSFNSAI